MPVLFVKQRSSVSEPPFEGHRDCYAIYPWLVRKLTVDFLHVIIQQIDLTAEAS